MSDEGMITVEQIHAQQAAFRATTFVTERERATHEKYAHLLPDVFPTGQGKPHTCGPDIGDGTCRCVFEPFKRGGLYVSWCGHDEIDSRKRVVRVLGEIDNLDSPGATLVVARVLASDAPCDVGAQVQFAPDSITGNTMEECEEPSKTQAEADAKATR